MPLTLAAAQAMLVAAVKHATETSAPVAIAVIDGGGYVVASARLDSAMLHATELAVGKATAALLYRRASSEFPWPASAPIEATMLRLGGRFIPTAGALPIREGGQVIGAVGVAGSRGEDEAIAQVALDAFGPTS